MNGLIVQRVQAYRQTSLANDIELESQLATADDHVTALERQIQQLRQQIDAKATGALAAVQAMPKTLTLLGGVQAA